MKFNDKRALPDEGVRLDSLEVGDYLLVMIGNGQTSPVDGLMLATFATGYDVVALSDGSFQILSPDTKVRKIDVEVNILKEIE